MFRKILVGNDGSAGAMNALRTALALAKRDGAELHEISVEEHLPRYGALMGELVEARQEARNFFHRVTQEAEVIAQAQNLTLISHVVPGHPVEAITKFAHDGGFDLLIVGFTGHSNIFGRIWGGTSQNLVRLSPCTVLVVK
ncbi:universal stress protein [Nitrospira sp. NS4]|uniref:universal stress protein n=1 Tax=Nitrospira sp. NS4 TaxID=3414498 RepID=UPI003C2C6036